MKINDYRKTSFLANVTDDEITDFLNKCGYQLNYNIVYETDGLKKPIERIFNPNNKVILEISAIDVYKQNLFYEIAKRAGFSNILDNSKYDSCSSMIICTDYCVFDIANSMKDTINDKLQKEYVKFMYAKFGENYKNCYNNYVMKHLETEREL